MIKINFYPDYDNDVLIKECELFANLWEEYGERIIKIIETTTNLKFIENEINCIIYKNNNIPESNPLRLRVSNEDKYIKLGGLIHELCHRLVVGNSIKFNKSPFDNDCSTEVHKLLNLFLYDVLYEFKGKDFANDCVEKEKSYSKVYKDAWEWSLKFGKVERKELFKKYKN